MRTQEKSCDHRNGTAFAIPAKWGMDLEWIREGLKRPGKTQAGLAAKLGLNPSQVNRLLAGDRQLKAHEIQPIAEYLGVAVPKDVTPPGFGESQARYRPDQSVFDKIPVLGTAEGGDEGWSLWNGDVVDHVARPPFLAGVPNAYACYVTGTSMEPRYHPGELIYVHPGKPVTIGSYVLVQARPRTEGEPPRAVVKRLAKKLAQKIVLEQFNPPRQFDIQTKDIVSMHRIMGSGE